MAAAAAAVALEVMNVLRIMEEMVEQVVLQDVFLVALVETEEVMKIPEQRVLLGLLGQMVLPDQSVNRVLKEKKSMAFGLQETKVEMVEMVAVVPAAAAVAAEVVRFVHSVITVPETAAAAAVAAAKEELVEPVVSEVELLLVFSLEPMVPEHR
jgi:hypothetical protein